MRNIFFASVGIVSMLITIAACTGNGKPAPIVEQPVTKDSLIKRGQYLVSIMGCDDCHSPKRMGARGPEVIPELRFSGFQDGGSLPPVDSTEIRKGFVLFNHDLTAAVGPWGASYSANISGDSTGIGSWTEQQFSKAMREGKFKGLDNTRPLLPPMPWPNFSKLTDPDLKAIFTFLQSSKPVKNAVPPPAPLAALK